jgi:hypothetical protein
MSSLAKLSEQKYYFLSSIKATIAITTTATITQSIILLPPALAGAAAGWPAGGVGPAAAGAAGSVGAGAGPAAGGAGASVGGVWVGGV